jgi:derlin-1
MGDFSDWYNRIPFFTRYWLTLTLAFSILGKLQILPVQYLFIHSSLVIGKLQLWRLLTALFFYPTGFNFLIHCFFIYQYSTRLEADHYRQSPADYLYLLIFNWLCCAIAGVIFDLPLLMEPMVLSVLYVWCQLNKEVIVTFWFGSRFKAMYLPWVLLGFNMLMSSGSLASILGIVVGHLYYFLKYVYPQELGGPSLLTTPTFLKRYFPDVTGGVFGVAPEGRYQNQEPPRAGGFGRNWGTGRRLGD